MCRKYDEVVVGIQGRVPEREDWGDLGFGGSATSMRCNRPRQWFSQDTPTTSHLVFIIAGMVIVPLNANYMYRNFVVHLVRAYV
jgi:hypothetical protein